MESLLGKPIRESGHLPEQVQRLSAHEPLPFVISYPNGRTVRQIATELRRSRTVSAAQLRERGVVTWPTMLDGETRCALELHPEGVPANRIGQFIGQHPKTVRSMIRRKGPTD